MSNAPHHPFVHIRTGAELVSLIGALKANELPVWDTVWHTLLEQNVKATSSPEHFTGIWHYIHGARATIFGGRKNRTPSSFPNAWSPLIAADMIQVNGVAHYVSYVLRIEREIG